MISTETAAVMERFASKVKRGAQARSKDIRLDMDEATALMAEIANVMARLAVYENATVTDKASLSVQMDGGSFKSK